jgi:hypothetical protein
MTLKILTALAGAPVGGAETFFVSLTCALKNAGLDATEQSQVSLVHQCSRLERLPRPLAAHARRRHLPQIIVDEGEQPRAGGVIPAGHGGENSRHVRHGLPRYSDHGSQIVSL